jgi:hypothetical protein
VTVKMRAMKRAMIKTVTKTVTVTVTSLPIRRVTIRTVTATIRTVTVTRVAMVEANLPTSLLTVIRAVRVARRGLREAISLPMRVSLPMEINRLRRARKTVEVRTLQAVAMSSHPSSSRVS